MATQKKDPPIIYYIGIFRNQEKPATELVAEKDLSSFSRFTRTSAGQLLEMGTKTIAERTSPGVRQQVEEGAWYKINAYAHSRGVCGVIVTNQTDEFGKLVAQQCLSKLVDEFVSMNPDVSAKNIKSPPLNKYIVDWRNTKEIDNITAVQKELDETKIVLHKTIESVLERGEKLDDLVAKSDNLNAASKMFYSTAKKQNSCCVVM